MRAGTLAGLIAVTCSPVAAEAQTFAADDPAIVTATAIGVAGGLVNTVATVVYMVDGRSFDTGWMVSSLFSTTICGALAVALTPEAQEPGQGLLAVPVVGLALLAGLPGGWAIRSAVHEALPGEPFDPERRARRRARAGAFGFPRDPFAPPPRLSPPLLGLPVLRF